MATRSKNLGVAIAVGAIGVPLILGLTAILTILNGWALRILWGWFIEPFGLMPLTMGHAIGVSMIVTFLTYQFESEKPKETKSNTGTIFWAFLRPFFSVSFGWVAYQFM